MPHRATFTSIATHIVKPPDGANPLILAFCKILKTIMGELWFAHANCTLSPMGPVQPEAKSEAEAYFRCIVGAHTASCLGHANRPDC